MWKLEASYCHKKTEVLVGCLLYMDLDVITLLVIYVLGANTAEGLCYPHETHGPHLIRPIAHNTYPC